MTLSPTQLFSLLMVTLMVTQSSGQTTLDLELRSQREAIPDSGTFEFKAQAETWNTSETAVIVCDVWDYHHCFNAVKRLEEFAPRLNDVLDEARKRGVTIIHAPSDCMDAYKDHPARIRAIQTTPSSKLPHDIQSWCSSIPSEEKAVYPIDQSDGGEDDDPDEHAKWAAKLKSMGRNPGTPWKKQSDMITIDDSKDFITDKGDEVWSILEQRGIKNVILAGVHTNMCVLGRPFGLRQMARNGKNVVLMRDMTDTMYNPKMWPYVSHFEGTRRIISHIERFVCPTVTSDQLIGGEPFRFKGDVEPDKPSEADTSRSEADFRKHWTIVSVPHITDKSRSDDQPRWYRCVVRIPSEWLDDEITLKLRGSDESLKAWCNGQPLTLTSKTGKLAAFPLDSASVVANDFNLIVVRIDGKGKLDRPVLHAGKEKLVLHGHWQFRVGNDPALANMPLPAKFGGSADIVFSPPDPLWTPRPVTRKGEFTKGIEGPACDSRGNIFAVNFARQGTIGRVRPDGTCEVFVDLPEGSVGNGIRFDADGSFFVADYKQHNILRVDPTSRAVTIFAHSDEMNQPNDLAIAADGTLYASDPNWSEGTGQLWRIDRDGSVVRLAAEMGTTNGIEVSPDGSTLYVNESKQLNVWAFTIAQDRSLSDKRLIRKFDDHGFDGMRCDVDGNLYITRYGKGVVVKMTPEGEILQEIPVLGERPSNICFGGPDGCTAYVTEVESTRLVSFRVDRPGRSWRK